MTNPQNGPPTLYDIFMKKYRGASLASVYLARFNDVIDLEFFKEEFVSKISPLPDHPDMLWVRLEEKENSYKVDSIGIKSLLNFLNYKALDLKMKFIFFEDAHLISDIVANKLLKVLEEMPVNTCLFLLCPKEENLLATVESRAIKISLPKSRESKNSDKPSFESYSLNEMLNHFKDSEDAETLERLFVESKCTKVLSKNHYQDCHDLLEKLKHFEQSKNFNNNKISRLSLIF